MKTNQKLIDDEINLWNDKIIPNLEKTIAKIHNSPTYITIYDHVMCVFTDFANIFIKTDLPNGLYTKSLELLTSDVEKPDYDFEKEIETVDKIPNFNLAKINELMKYVEKDSVTSTQNGIYYDSNATKLVANDRYTMKYIDSLMGGHDFIIHAESIKELNKLSKLEHLSNVFLLKDNKMKFMFENIVYICDLIVGKYLPWASVIPNYANGYLISISSTTINEISKFSETIMNTRKSLKLKKITIQVYFNLKENKINIYDIETDMQKTWNFKSKFQDCPTNHCGVIMPIQISEDDMEFVLDSELLLKVSCEDLFFGEKNSAILLIPKTNESR